MSVSMTCPKKEPGLVRSFAGINDAGEGLAESIRREAVVLVDLRGDGCGGPPSRKWSVDDEVERTPDAGHCVDVADDLCAAFDHRDGGIIVFGKGEAAVCKRVDRGVWTRGEGGHQKDTALEGLGGVDHGDRDIVLVVNLRAVAGDGAGDQYESRGVGGSELVDRDRVAHVGVRGSERARHREFGARVSGAVETDDQTQTLDHGGALTLDASDIAQRFACMRRGRAECCARNESDNPSPHASHGRTPSVTWRYANGVPNQ
jgi:hypothetical protein